MYSRPVWAAKESWRGSPRSKRATAPGGDTASVLAAYGPRGAPSSAARAAAGGEASADGQTARASTSNQMLVSEARRRSRKSASPVRAELPAKGAASQRVLSTERVLTERVLEAEERTDESEAEEPTESDSARLWHTPLRGEAARRAAGAGAGSSAQVREARRAVWRDVRTVVAELAFAPVLPVRRTQHSHTEVQAGGALG